MEAHFCFVVLYVRCITVNRDECSPDFSGINIPAIETGSFSSEKLIEEHSTQKTAC